MRKRHLASAFTLIELLVVVSIITLLIAISLPSLGRARENARQSVCQTHMRAWAQGFHIYAGNYDDALPLDGDNGTTSAPVGRWDDSSLWFNGLAQLTNNIPYNNLQLAQPGGPTPAPHTGLPGIGANSLYICPSATASGAGSGDTVNNGYFQTVGWDASFNTTTRDMLLCYGYNSQLRNIKYSSTNYPGAADPAKPADIAKLSILPPTMVLVAEKRINPAELDLSDPLQSAVKTQALTQLKVAPKRFAARHKKGGSLAFADAHVEWFSFDAVNAANNATPQYNQPGLMLWSAQ